MERMEHDTVLPSHTSRQLQVKLRIVDENLQTLQEYSEHLSVKLDSNQQCCVVVFIDGSGKTVLIVRLSQSTQIYHGGSYCVQLRVPEGSAVVTLESHNDTTTFLHQLYSSLSHGSTTPKKQSVFSLRTEEASAKQYFQFYGFLSQQQNMMQDFVRTSTYQSAMLQNTDDFIDKVVMDMGAGSGILSFFAVQAGAKKVYAVEASNMAIHCQRLIQANHLSNKVVVIAGKIEEIDIPEKVDVIISEPMGYMLLNERMLESYIHARKWLKPDGKMFPSQGILYCAPFTDEMLYMEQYNKATFWCQQHFHGIDLSSLREAAMEEYFKQPVVDTFDTRVLMAKPVGHTFDFQTISESSLYSINIPFSCTLYSSGCIHGLAFWFDVSFNGSQETVWLSTAPFQPLTHWYQIRCLINKPFLGHSGQQLSGFIHMKANDRQSYDIDIQLNVIGTALSSKYSYDLKNPFFRYTGIHQNPPGTHHTNPTADFMISTQMNSSQTINNTQPVEPIPQSSLMNGSIQSNTSYIPYQNVTGYSTTSVYGQPLMTPGTAGGVPIAGSGQLWFPGQSGMYDTTMHYHKTGSAAGYVSLPNHS